jgi:hypothetical protein
LLALAMDAPSASAQELPRLGCDPVSFHQPMPIPSGTELVCGDGRVGEYTRSCSAMCSGGCPGVGGCGPTQCARAREVCDGADLDGQSCRTRGFSGGTLACDAGCERFDVSGCDVCFSRPGVRCAVTDVDGPIGEVQVSPSGDETLLAWNRPDGLHLLLATEDLDLEPERVLVDERLLDVLPVDGGWLVATASGTGVEVRRWTRRGAAASLELAGATEGRLYPLSDGGIAIAGGLAVGAPFRIVDAQLRAYAPRLPLHAVRSDGARLLVLDAAGHGEITDPRVTGGMHTSWTPAAGDLVIAFAGARSSGVQAIQDGRVTTGIGWSLDSTPDAAAQLGPIPRTSGSSDPLWRAAVPDEAAPAGGGRVELHLEGTRYRDTWAPSGGRPIVFTGAQLATDGAPAAVFAVDASVPFTRFVSVGRRFVGVAVQLGAADRARLWIARGARRRGRR